MQTNVVEIIDKFYEKADKRAAKLVEEEKPSCSKGCHGCCFQLIGISAAEAIHIIEKIYQRPDIRDILRRCCAAAAPIFTYKTPTDGFRAKVPCVFLNGGLCSIYSFRPIVCRYYFVSSPPEACHPDAPTEEILMYDMHTKAIDYGVDVSIEMMKSYPARVTPAAGPLPAMLVWAAAFVFQGGDKIWANKLMEKLPDCSTWHKSLL